MPNILFASNSVSHFVGSEISNLSWGYDSNRVPYAIRAPLETVISTPNFEETTTDNTWFHFTFGSSLWYVNNDEPICEIVDIDGSRIVRFSNRDHYSYGWRLDTNIDGNINTYLRVFPIPDSRRMTCDIRIGLTGVQAHIEVFVNEMRIFDVTYAIASHKKPRALWLGGLKSNGNEHDQLFSEIIVADGDTRNARLDLLRPVAAGAYGNWDGPLSSLSDDDPTTGMTTTSPDQNQSTILTPYTGANNISNIVQVTTSVRGINSPTQLQHLVRMSAVDYLTSSFAVPFEKDYQITDWTLNPATSLPWAAVDIETAEFGFKSIA